MAKVCGLTTAADVMVALAAGADLVGFLHHPPSPRHCPDLVLARSAGNRAILVTVAADAQTLLERARQGGTHWVQPYLPAAVRAQALARLAQEGFEVLLPWPDEPDQEPLPAALYLWETSPRDTGVLGGSGRGHAMLYPPPGPFLLGGGLRGDLLAARLEAMPPGIRGHCRGFDAASGLEDRPGRKETALVAAFVRAAHALSPERSAL